MNLADILKKGKNKISIYGISQISDIIANFLNVKSNNLEIEIICESDNYLFSKAILSDTNNSQKRISYTDYKFEQRRISDELASMYVNNKNVSIQISYIDIPIRIVIVDGIIYSANWIIIPSSNYIKLKKTSENFESINNYIKLMQKKDIGQKYLAPYKNDKGKIIETIELFDEERIRRGVFPRSAFYDSDFIKLVVWVYIFDRNGRMLIHKRALNAKDNQGMWDKSVGGHADYINDIDTSKTVPREVIEELVTDENLGSTFIKTNDDDVIFLGEWRPDKRLSNPFKEIELYNKNWVYFRLPEFERTSSPRLLPDGKTKGNEVIADTYLFLLSEDIDTEKIADFKNSSYKLLYPSEIKSAIQNSISKTEDKNFNGLDDLKFTPDLIYTFSGKLRQHLEQFSKFIITHTKNG